MFKLKNNSFRIGYQEDAAEFLLYLIEAKQIADVGLELYYQRTCNSCQHSIEYLPTQTIFLDLPITRDSIISDVLNDYLDGNGLTLNKYFFFNFRNCMICLGNQEFTERTFICSPKKFVVLVLKRFSNDYHTSLRYNIAPEEKLGFSEIEYDLVGVIVSILLLI